MTADRPADRCNPNAMDRQFGEAEWSMTEAQNPYATPHEHCDRGSCTSDSVVEFEFSLYDWLQFVMRETHKERSNNIARFRIRYLILVVLFSLFAFIIWTTFAPGALPMALVAVFYFFKTLRLKTLIHAKAQKQLEQMMSRRSNAGLLGRQVVTLRTDGFETVFPAGRSEWQWWAVPEVVVDDDYLFIYLSAVDAKTIPARAFASDSDYRAFADRAVRLWGSQRRLATSR